MKEYIKKMVRESIDFHVIESLMDEDYPSGFDMEHFNSLKSFNQRVKYAQENLQRISSGTARIVYKIDDTKVLKLAKNPKGLAQNRAEMAWKDKPQYRDLLAQVLDSHPYGLWVEMELAKRVTPTMFKNYFGVSLIDFEDYITLKQYINSGKKIHVYPHYSVIEALKDNKFVNDIMAFMKESKSLAGEFGRLSSYGLVNRDGQDRIVLIDFGLTSDIYDSYYN